MFVFCLGFRPKILQYPFFGWPWPDARCWEGCGRGAFACFASFTHEKNGIDRGAYWYILKMDPKGIAPELDEMPIRHVDIGGEEVSSKGIACFTVELSSGLSCQLSKVAFKNDSRKVEISKENRHLQNSKRTCACHTCNLQVSKQRRKGLCVGSRH